MFVNFLIFFTFFQLLNEIKPLEEETFLYCKFIDSCKNQWYGCLENSKDYQILYSMNIITPPNEANFIQVIIG